MHLTFYFLCHKSLPKQWTAVTYFYDIKITLSLWIALEKDEHFRPLNSHSFTLCHTVSLPFSQSHGISHGFTNFKRIFLSNSQFPKKTNQATKYCSIAFYIQKKKTNKQKKSGIFNSETSTRSSTGNDVPWITKISIKNIREASV